MSVMATLDRWIPERLNLNALDHIRARIFLVMLGILILMDAAFFTVLFVLGVDSFVIAKTVSFLLLPKQLIHVVCFIAFFYGKSTKLASLLLVWCFFFWLWFGVLLSGALSSPFLLVFVFFPVLSSLLVSAGHGLLMFFTTVVFLIILKALDAAGFHLPILISIPKSSDVYTFVVINCLLSAPMIFGAYEMILRAMKSQMKRDRKQFLEYAEYENLTGLLNYSAFENIMHSNLLQKVPFALFYIDLDNFKLINQRYGVKQGDKILQQLAARISNIVDNQQVVSRVGSDEFAVIVYLSDQKLDCHDFANSIKEAIEKPIILDEEDIIVKCHVGYHSTVDGGKTKASLYSIAKSRMLVAD